MHAVSHLLAGLCLLDLAFAVPRSAQRYHQLSDAKCSSSASNSTISHAEPTPKPTESWRRWCEPGQRCDCSRIKDKNGDELGDLPSVVAWCAVWADMKSVQVFSMRDESGL